LSFLNSEAPRGKPRGIFARLGGAFGEAWAESCEAKDAILSSIAASATEDHPCGNLLRQNGYTDQEP